MSPPNGVPPGNQETLYPHPHLETLDEETSEKCEKSASNKKIDDTAHEETELLDKICNDVESEDIEVVVPPDGGWGWVVVAASFVCNMIVDGIIFAFSMFLDDIGNEFNVTKTQVALVGSLMSGFYLITGPFVSALANRYGFNMVAIGGSIFAAFAFSISYFAPNVTYLCVTFGVLGGIGFGLIYAPAVITVGFYFERWRALATGIAVCGSGIGTFMFAPLTSYLIKEYGWRKTLLFQVAIVLVCVVAGAMFRPLKPKKLKEIEKELNDEEPQLIMDPSLLPAKTKAKMESALKQMTRSNISINQNSVNNNSNYPTVSEVYNTIHVPHLGLTDLGNEEKRRSVPAFFDHDKLKQVNEDGNPLLSDARKSNTKIATKDSSQCEINRPLYRDDIFFTASLTRLPQYNSKASLAYTLSVTHLPTYTDIEEEKKGACKLCPEAIKRTLSTMLDFSLLKSPTFIILSISGFFTMMGFYVPFMFLKNRAEVNGMIGDISVWLIPSIGIANTVGRILCGVLSSFPGVDALFVNNIALTIGGIATICSGWSVTNEFQFTYTVVFGLAIACFASLRSIIVVDLMGLEKLTNAFGLLLLFQGIAAIIGSPLAGAFMDLTNSYNASFYLSGCLILVSAIITYPLNCINRWEINRANKEKSVPV